MDPDDRMNRESLDASVDVTSEDYSPSDFLIRLEENTERVSIPKEYLTSSGDVNYLKIGKLMCDHKELQRELEEKIKKEHRGDSRVKKWLKKRSENNKTLLANKINQLEQKIEGLGFQKNSLPGDLVLTFNRIYPVPWNFDVNYVTLNKNSRKKNLVGIIY